MLRVASLTKATSAQPSRGRRAGGPWLQHAWVDKSNVMINRKFEAPPRLHQLWLHESGIAILLCEKLRYIIAIGVALDHVPYAVDAAVLCEVVPPYSGSACGDREQN